MASEFLTADPFVAFVGAGGSALPPSNLPTWTEFNSLLLQCLCERLAEFSENRQPVAEILALFQKRRDQTRFFSPDFQAQLMEEELGVEYFRVWRSLETDAYGPMHAQLAELGARGRLAAIITTNFDRLLETALAARRLPCAVFYDEASFGLLARRNKGIALPVIKIHGSIEDPMSLVDTLRQRVAGRPASLQNVLNGLLRRFPWIYLGFSGADFSYEPNYLNVLGSAKDARGFTFITRPGSTVKEGVRVLEKEYGPAKASIVTGDLATWLAETFGLGQCLYPDAAPGGVAAVRQKISEWTASLGPMAVVNIFWSMLKSAGMEYQAFWLMRKTWKSYRRPEDASAKSYARYNYNYGKSLLEARFIARPVAREKDNSNYWEWKEEADQDAVQFLHRSYVQGKLAVAGAELARALAYRGELSRASGIVNGVTNEVLASGSKLVLCDVAAASAAVYDILQMFGGPIEQFRGCMGIAKELGDEPRRAQLSAHLGRFLTYAGDFDGAAVALTDAERIARRLDLQSVLLEARAARGLWCADSGISLTLAIDTLEEVLALIAAMEAEPLFIKVDLTYKDAEPQEVRGRRPLHCRVLLDLNRAALLAGDEDRMNATLDGLDEMAVEVFPGYCPHYYFAYAACLIKFGSSKSDEKIRALIDRARRLGKNQGNSWTADMAAFLESKLG